MGYYIPFNYIGPLMQIGEEIFSGKKSMAISMIGSGMTAHDVCQLLEDYGVEVGRGGFMFGNDIVIPVSDRQLAREILDYYGIG